MVTPYFSGGDLLKSVVPQEGTGEAKARRWFRQILLGIGYIHSKVSGCVLSVLLFSPVEARAAADEQKASKPVLILTRWFCFKLWDSSQTSGVLWEARATVNVGVRLTS